ncbi:hypothetical protein C806_03834 [Lachnospiraceae bacterium 3-1]|nr:hypothetical protein C806_03834 [Lachnospiraceae bacterium 3-1]
MQQSACYEKSSVYGSTYRMLDIIFWHDNPVNT